MKTLGIHVFRRDLRLEDNTALNALLKSVDRVVPVFVFDDRQVKGHAYQSGPGLQMLCESLKDLDAALRERGAKLHVRTGIAEEEIAKLLEELAPTALSYNKDYTPFSLARDAEIDTACSRAGVSVFAEHDATLHAPGTLVTKDGKPYSVYTHYRIAAEGRETPLPARLPKDATFVEVPGSVDLAAHSTLLVPAPRMLRVQGGRTVAKDMLKGLNGKGGYASERDFPAVPGTSLLSAHIKFGTLSMREIYHYAKLHMPNPETYLRELLWHDFFTTVAALTPHVYTGAYRKEFDALRWNTDEDAFTAWKEGKTGFPIVDAGMRELKETGYMHNRVRMITASFLVKDLHISWQRGEQYFAQTLSDYDPAVNNGNWQWVAGTGCDASPWFRIFNPWLQQEKFDAECTYILKWLPELAGLTPKEIHDPEGAARIRAGYPAPMLDHKAEAAKTKELFGILSNKEDKP